ncbi:Ribosomal-protein-S5p-alanine acetyltransferase [Streptococcus sp. DD12]|nr:Ribosomal-protein-S5p-alanine acetyltransferase [Streptococcus sp. DD12]
MYQFIETPLCHLRPLRMSDFDRFYAIISCPQNTAFIFPSRQDPDEVSYLMAHNFIKNPLGIWAIASKTNDDFWGIIRLENIQVSKRTAEVGYFLHRDLWGQGLMTDCLKTLCDFSFGSFGLEELLIKTHAENVASQRVAQKVGFLAGQGYRASDRYSHKVRHYQDYYLTRKAWAHE